MDKVESRGEAKYSTQKVEVKASILIWPMPQPRILESPREKIYRPLHLEEIPTGLLSLCVIIAE